MRIKISKDYDYKFIIGREAIEKHFIGFDNSVFLLGKGFDPRMCEGLLHILRSFKKLDVVLCDYEKSILRKDTYAEKRCNDNIKRLEELCGDKGYKTLDIPQFSIADNERKHLVISNSVNNQIKTGEIADYDNIVIDISAMPRTVAFSVIRRILSISDNKKVYIVVCENSLYDDRLTSESDEHNAQYLDGFNTFQFTQESENYSTVWFPALGDQEERTFDILANYIEPIEICPIVPFPSADISRSEKLLRQYGLNIFRDRGVDTGNIIYIPEKYPVLIFHRLYDTVKYYDKALNVDGASIRYAFSSQSSKLIDLGILLTILSLVQEGIPVGYAAIEDSKYLNENDFDKERQDLYCLCINEDELDW